MNKVGRLPCAIVTLAFFTVISGPWRNAWADSSIDSVRASSGRIDTILHELTHVVQQAQGSSSSAKTTEAAQSVGPGTDTVGKVHTLASQLVAQTADLQRIYRDRDLTEGVEYMNRISTEARKIIDLTQSLGFASGSSETAQYYRRVSERLRHINRANTDHEKWIDTVSMSWPSSQAKAEIHTPEYGRVKTRLPQEVSESGSRMDGDPDRPLVAGRVANASASSGGQDRPTESIALNYSKIKIHSASVHTIYEFGDQLFLLDRSGNAYSLPNGIYSSSKGSSIQIKGKKILQNFTDTQSSSSGTATGKRTQESIGLGGSNTEQNTRVSGLPGIRPVQFTIKSASGRYAAPGGSWFELKGETITNIGGLLHKHGSLPFVPMDTPRSKKKGKVETEFKVEEGE